MSANEELEAKRKLLAELRRDYAALGTQSKTFEHSIVQLEAAIRRDELAAEILTSEDLRCPSCGANDFWLQENADRGTWQPVQLGLDEGNELVEDDYMSFDYGDDVRVTSFECRECQQVEWQTLEELRRALVAAKHARADAEALERTLGLEAENALAVLICDTRIRGFLEQHDPKALEQARRALSLFPSEKEVPGEQG